MASMRFREATRCALGLLVAVASAGCGKSAAPSRPFSGTGGQISQQAADDIARHYAASLARQGGLPLDRVAGSSLSATAQQGKSSVSARMLDEGELSWSLSIKFFAIDGAEQMTYLHGATARMTVDARVRGRFVTAEHQARVGVHRWLDVQGLLPDVTTIEIDGAANDTADCAFASTDGSEERSYHLLSAGQFADVMKLKDEQANPYPLSGTARWDVAADAFTRDPNGTTEAHYEVAVVVTFNGTRYPTVEVNERYTYRVDLESGEVVRLPS
jgi:hypothetical protein